MKIEATGGDDVWEERTFDLTNVPTGVHDVHFSFVGAGKETLFNWDWWQFNEEAASAIEAVPDASEEGTSVFYTLQGVPVAHPTKGIYIRHGRKVLVR